MDASQWLTVLLLGGLMGMIGQAVRVIIGLKKANDEANNQSMTFKEVFQPHSLLTSLLIGFVAGSLAIATQAKTATNVDSSLLLGIMAAGYAGTDFVEGFFKRYLGGAGGNDGGGKVTEQPAQASQTDDRPTPAWG